MPTGQTQNTYIQFYNADGETFLFRRTIKVSNQGHLDSNATAWSCTHVDMAVTTNDELECGISSYRANLGKPYVFVLELCSYTYRTEPRDTCTAAGQIATHDHAKFHVSLKVERNAQLSLVRRHAAAAALCAQAQLQTTDT
jgi:hypothetical protein